MKYKDYYETLGVPKTATQDEIKTAFRKLVRKYHPDVSKVADAEARFKEVNEANEVLKDAEKRAAYDQVGRGFKAGQDFQPPPNWDEGFEFRGRPQAGGNPFGGGGASNFDDSDFFESLFGGRRGGARQRGPTAGGDHHAKVLIDLEDSYRGAERSISLRMPAAGGDG
ncbi:MAG: DnaJ domain-containing protein, partial [Caldimonas sp.]